MGKLTVTAEPGVPFIDMHREFDAPRELLFRAHTDPELIKQWLGPRGYEIVIDHYDCRANYHETLTRFWIQQVRGVLKNLTEELPLLEATNSVVEKLGNSRLAFDYYTKGVVESAAARQGWVEPDLKPISHCQLPIADCQLESAIDETS